MRATQDVENALLTCTRQQELTAVLAWARVAAASAYDQGVVSLIEVLQADEGLLSVRDAQAQARLVYQSQTTRAAHRALRRRVQHQSKLLKFMKL